MRADVHRFSLIDPSDVSGLRTAIDSGAVDPATIVAVIGKTHGNGLVNDYTRGYLTLSLSLLIGERLGQSAEAVRARIPFVFSGGVEGVLPPHYTVLTVASADAPASNAAGKALAVGVAFTASIAGSLPWATWQVSLTDGQPLMDLQLDTVADNAGIRIRWAELCALLRKPIHRLITFGAELTGCERGAGSVVVTWRDRASGTSHRVEDIDLLIAADGRYSLLRDYVLGAPETPRLLGVCLCRVLFPAGADCPIDDYGQWFNGANRLLAFRVPGGFIYCAGSFPVPTDGGIPEAMKSAGFLGDAYRPERGQPSPQAAYLIAAVQRHVDRIHWARLQEGSVAYGREPGVLLVGDSAHPMVPTLGQGATQACEDACVVVDEVRSALELRRPLATVPERVEHRRGERVRFVVEFSREATGTMLAGADPVAGTLRKCEPAFRRKLERLYRDVPMPGRL